jgi:hypothetical protein
MDYAALVELIGFDIIFLGLLTLLTCYIARTLWRVSRSSECLVAFRKGWEQYCDYLEGCVQRHKGEEGPGKAEQTEKDKADETDASTKRPARATQLIGMLLMASVLGMVINIVGDRLLDSDVFVRTIPFIWSDVRENKETKKEERRWWPCVTWHPEDAIKYDALKAVSNLYNDQKDTFQANHKITKAECDNWDEGSEGESGKEAAIYQKGESHAKELFQRAYAWTLSSNNTSVQAALRYEYLVIKVLRTLFASSIILLLVAIFGPWRRAAVLRLLGAKIETPLAAKIKAWVICVLLFSLPFLFLALWSTQSKRYDKKVFHAYILMAKDNDNDVLKLSPGATPSPTPPTQNGK